MSSRLPYIALMGNPNSGKTAIFNLLTGLNQKVSNYPGITVEKKTGEGYFTNGDPFVVLDLPGTYSLSPESFEEKIVSEQILKWVHGEDDKPEVLVTVVDASNLNRNLFFVSQLTEIGIPVIIALNMMDIAERRKLDILPDILRNQLGVQDVIPMSALEKRGVDQLKDAIRNCVTTPIRQSTSPHLSLPGKVIPIMDDMIQYLEKEFKYSHAFAIGQALRILSKKSLMDLYGQLESVSKKQFSKILDYRLEKSQELIQAGIRPKEIESTVRYELIDRFSDRSTQKVQASLDNETRSEKVDKILTHKFFGPIVFILVLYSIFVSIFTWAAAPMDWIEAGVSIIANAVLEYMNPGILRDIIVEGIISGVGAILVFLPQILILVFFLTILEDSGYMARVAIMMDKFMTRVGLHGRSVLPIMSGYACAIPGIMSTRTIDSWKERLITILIIPLISCSARLPVYALLIGAFIPDKHVFGFIQLQSLVLIFMYFLGTVTALILAKLFSRLIDESGQSSFIMEIPPYRVPLMRSVFRQVHLRGKLFIANAGKIIMAISIVLWFLASFPGSPENENSNRTPIHFSYAGKIGHAIEPVLAPLGFDWKIGIGLITSFAAREVMVSTMATIYNVESDGENVVNLTEAMRSDINESTGLPRYTPLTALSLMVFFVYAAQCMATFAIVRNETNSWKWPLFMIGYLSILAYTASFVVYQGGKLLGYS